MEKSLIKNLFLFFITPFVLCMLLEYFFFHDLIQGILPGIGAGLGVCMGKRHENKRKKREKEETKN
jgi:positive regulator of sigma E activity